MLKGDNILGLNLKSSTISGYLGAAAKLYTDRQLLDPFSCKGIKKNYPKMLLDALKQYEGQPDRREVITDAMFEYIDELAQNAHPDSLIRALNDWLKWSRYSGPRSIEWCQTTKTKFKLVEEGYEDEPYAFTPRDIKFFDNRGRMLDPRTHSFERVLYATVCWRFQKNGHNDEEIKYYRDFLHPRWCPVRPLWDIIQRAIRLNVGPKEPLAKYIDVDGKAYWIIDKDVNSTLQNAARVKLGITDPKVLSKWTTHSLRVTAANELHRLGFSALYIQIRIRWQSLKFMNYLRHTIHVARNHTKGMSLSKENLVLTESNHDEVNDMIKIVTRGDSMYRRLADYETMWDENHRPTAAPV